MITDKIHKYFLQGEGFSFPLVRIVVFVGDDIFEAEINKGLMLFAFIQKYVSDVPAKFSQYTYDEIWSVVGGKLDNEWGLDVEEQSKIMCQVVVFENDYDKENIERLGLVVGIDLLPVMVANDELTEKE